MPSTYTQSLRLELMATGEDDTTWGDRANENLKLIEAAMTGVTTITIPDKDYVLSVNFAQDDEARSAVLVAQGNLTAARAVVVPPFTKTYIVRNITSGGQTITVKTASGGGVDVSSGEVGIMYCDGANVVSAASVTKDGTLVPSKISAASSGWRLNGALGINRSQAPDENVGIHAIDGAVGSRIDLYAAGKYIGYLSAGAGGITLGGNSMPLFFSTTAGAIAATLGTTGAWTMAGPFQAGGISSTGALTVAGNAAVQGGLTVGANTTLQALSVNGNASLNTASVLTMTVNTNLVYTSDERLKHKWLDIPDGFVAGLAKVKAGTYALKSSGVRGTRYPGSSAQDWLKLLPSAVDATDPNHLKLDYARAAMVSTVALAREIEALKARIAELSK